MRQKFFTLLLISAVGLVSCRKDKIEQDIKQYDESQIQNYISTHGITGMQKDTTGGDTTGIYYKLLLPGKVVPPATTLVPLDYPDQISIVFSLNTLDGTYTSADTIQNHIGEYLGHLTSDALPYGLQLAIKNILKYKGASARLLIPSHLAYGVNGYKTSGSSTVANSNIPGNQSLDYYVHIIDDFNTYDRQVIKNNYDISTYTMVQDPLDITNFYYYKILTPGTGTSPITDNSSVVATYTGSLLNGTVFDGGNNGDNPATLTPATLVKGVREALEAHAVAGTKISMIIPSIIGYANTTAGTIPANSVLRFTFAIQTVTP